MPLHRLLRLSPTAVLGLWHRTETAAALGALLPAGAPYAALLPPTAGSERQGQWLAGRVLAHAAAAALWPGAPGLLVRNDAATGRPYLEGPGVPASAVVSLSHSGEWAAALLATGGQVGVDVELVRDKARRISTKFLAADELAAAQRVGTDAYFTLLWSAKETLYKLAERRGLIFKEQLLLEPFTPASAGEIPMVLRLAEGQSRHRICYSQPAAGYVLTHCWEPGAPTATP
ncbi:4'-phosphopantetheinyl transferase family protein [Hymenobacter nivis]|uniref:Enterobactin synthase component D n=1 Tax=Hymenobacter nivis TaxID=1850093 RepID=A0A502H1V7_9BACT|nr:4'-phosphopantetheinyl transferase superfamily protein [Hymenobacter nivis]TPG67360.1 4'-phosphopantetheinyl transferase superfamily protein [Hymenobacter nivis]